jgi:hypothetical protein
MGGDSSVNEILNQALGLRAAKATVGPPARLWEEWGRASKGIQLPVIEQNICF